jgi:hypothetical protein
MNTRVYASCMIYIYIYIYVCRRVCMSVESRADPLLQATRHEYDKDVSPFLSVDVPRLVVRFRQGRWVPVRERMRVGGV